MSIVYVSTIFGRIDEGVIGALINTTPKESLEFISGVDLKVILYSISISLLMTYLLNKVYSYFDDLNINRFFYILPYIIIVLSLEIIGWNAGKIIKQDSDLLPYYMYTVEFQDKQKATIKNKWMDIHSNKNNKHNVNIIVIGESARKDRLSMYGYKKPTSLPLDHYPGLIKFKGGISPGTHTEQSVPYILTKNRDLNFNIVDLAKSAGYETFWISNQGVGSENNSLIYAIAQQSNTVKFMSYSWTNPSDDFDMLPYIKKYISSDNKNKVIFVHIMGSHYSFCRRVLGSKGNVKEGIDKFSENFHSTSAKELNNECYDESILKTSYFIKQILDYLNNKNIKYNLSYFSDHGLININKSPYLIHAPDDNQEARNVPFILFNNGNKIKNIDCEFHLNKFYYLFSKMLNIKSNQIKKDQGCEFIKY